tara:strand:+ start:301 stop:2073 length:1773 start_codon:yes stop_codon:yes gene_type:complete
MSVYKQFLPNDYAVVPFNAHKQYEFDPTSSLSSSITFTNTKYSQLSIDNYDSSSDLTNNPEGFDNIKYSQIDHLFYRNYLTDLSNKFGDIDYLKHNRTLYEKCTILSIPSGLYGHKIKPGSLEFKGGPYTFVDDFYGNLIPKGTNVNNFITDPRLILVNLGPINGFKRYDLNIYNNFIENIYYKKGQPRVNTITSYSTPLDKYEYDDSYFLNKIHYNKVNFAEADLSTYVEIPKKFPSIDFKESGSEVKIPHNSNLDFNENSSYAIEFFIRSNTISHSDKIHVLSKSTLATISPSPTDYSNFPEDSSEGLAESQYPFQIYLTRVDDGNNLLHFSVSDGEQITEVNTGVPTGSFTHIVCNRDNNLIKIHRNGSIYAQNEGYCTRKSGNNNANIYIGGGPNIMSRFNNHSFSGSICNLKIYDKQLSSTNIVNHYDRKNGSPYVGNIFYSHGLVNVTHPAYMSQYDLLGIGEMDIDNNDIIEPIFTVGGVLISNHDWLKNIKFQGSHLIYENEYKCTIDESEFNSTLNLTVRKNKSLQEENLANFATGSLFKPYITTVGLYNEKNELLVVGKLGQPIRTSNETDTTLVVRWDT